MRVRITDSKPPSVRDTALFQGALLEIQRLATRINDLETQLIWHGITPVPSRTAGPTEDTLTDLGSDDR